MLPLLLGHARHPRDPALAGTWARRLPERYARDAERHSNASECTSRLMLAHLAADEDLCWRLSLHNMLVWKVLRFAGNFRDEQGNVVFFVNTAEEVQTLQETFPAAQVVSVGVHEEQLRPEVFFALRHVEVAARLEYMAEARGLPKPGKPHPDAEAQEDLGGDRCDSDADFEREPALPGEGSQSEDEEGAASLRGGYTFGGVFVVAL